MQYDNDYDDDDDNDDNNDDIKRSSVCQSNVNILFDLLQCKNIVIPYKSVRRFWEIVRITLKFEIKWKQILLGFIMLITII